MSLLTIRISLICSRGGSNSNIRYFTPTLSPFELPEQGSRYSSLGDESGDWVPRHSRRMPSGKWRKGDSNSSLRYAKALYYQIYYFPLDCILISGSRYSSLGDESGDWVPRHSRRMPSGKAEKGGKGLIGSNIKSY